MDDALKARCQPPGMDTSFYRGRIVRPLSLPVTSLLLKLHVPANAVSVAKGLLGVLGAAAFAFPSRTGLAAGILLLQISFFLDACDGEVARATGTCATAGGEFLDKIGDATMRSMLYLCWGIGAWRCGGRFVFLLAGALMASLWLVTRFCVVETLLENLSHRGAEGAGALSRMEKALCRAFVRDEEGAGTERFLSLVFHPFINTVALLSIPEFFVRGIAVAGTSVCPREAALGIYFILWSVNAVRKIPSSFRIADVRR